MGTQMSRTFEGGGVRKLIFSLGPTVDRTSKILKTSSQIPKGSQTPIWKNAFPKARCGWFRLGVQAIEQTAFQHC